VNLLLLLPAVEESGKGEEFKFCQKGLKLVGRRAAASQIATKKEGKKGKSHIRKPGSRGHRSRGTKTMKKKREDRKKRR